MGAGSSFAAEVQEDNAGTLTDAHHDAVAGTKSDLDTPEDGDTSASGDALAPEPANPNRFNEIKAACKFCRKSLERDPSIEP